MDLRKVQKEIGGYPKHYDGSSGPHSGTRNKLSSASLEGTLLSKAFSCIDYEKKYNYEQFEAITITKHAPSMLPSNLNIEHPFHRT